MVEFLKKGKASQEALKKSQKEAVAREEQAKGPRRFWLKEGEEADITFLEGIINKEDGLLDFYSFYEHSLKIGDKWGNFFVCIKEFEPCPLCLEGHVSYYQGVFSIIDHTAYIDKKGKVWKDQVKLYVAKQGTLQKLQIFATKKHGIAGMTFNVQRTNSKEARVGDMMIPGEKAPVPTLLKKYKVQLIDYKKVIIYRNSKELAELGFGVSVVGDNSGAPANKDDF